MKINVEQIPEEGSTYDFDQPCEDSSVLIDMARSGGCRFEKPISYRLEIKRFGQFVDIRGAFKAVVQLVCSRCLQPFAQPLQSRFHLTYQRQEQLPADDAGEETTIELNADDLGVIPFDSDEIDLSDALPEEVVMALPMQPLCDENCKGLCPQCGIDLNRNSCSCRNGVVNSNFAVLKGLKLDE